MTRLKNRLLKLEEHLNTEPEAREAAIRREVLSRLSDEDLRTCEQVVALSVGAEFTRGQKGFLDRHEELLEKVRSAHRLE